MKPIRFYLIALIIVVADQITKWFVVHRLPPNGVPVIGSFLKLTYITNTGGAFSLFQTGNRTFIVIAVIAATALIYAYHRYQRINALVGGALALALGGAIGNLIDRISFGHVIDFFDIQAGTGHNIYPIFNVADSAITVGIVLLAWHFLFSKEPAKDSSDQLSVVSHQSAAATEILTTDD